jgi:predicted Zn-dependent protease
MRLSEDQAINERVARVAARLVAVVGGDWQILVVETDPPTIGAFSLSGNKVGVHSGLLPLIHDDAELAFAVAHEIAHCLAGHALESASAICEIEADRLAVLVMTKAGYDPRGAITLLQGLPPALPSAPHPSNELRIAWMKEWTSVN